MILILFKPISVFHLLPLKHKDRNRVSLLPPFPEIILDRIFTEGEEFTDKEIYIRKHLTNIILILQFKEGKKARCKMCVQYYQRLLNKLQRSLRCPIVLHKPETPSRSGPDSGARRSGASRPPLF